MTMIVTVIVSVAALIICVVGVIWAIWLHYAPDWTADTRPPCPGPGEHGYVEWMARYGPMPLAACAARALAEVEKQKRQDERLRAIIREELARSASRDGSAP